MRQYGADTMSCSLNGGSELKLTGTILRIYSYLYHLILGLFLTALGGLTLASGHHNLNLGMLPWKGASLTWWVFGLGLAGIVFVVLAVTNLFRFAFPLWCLFVAILMIRGFFLSFGYVFSGPDQFRAIVWLTIGAFGAFLSSLPLFQRRTGRY